MLRSTFTILTALGFACSALASGHLDTESHDAESGLSVITDVQIVAMDGSPPLRGKAVVIESKTAADRPKDRDVLPTLHALLEKAGEKRDT